MAKSVLFVDDEPNILKALGREFRSWAASFGYELLFAESAKTALATLAARTDVLLVVSDYRMPGMNGSELIQEISGRYPEVGTVMLSGCSDEEEKQAAVISGKSGYVKKPWSTEMLAMEMNRVLSGRSGRSL